MGTISCLNHIKMTAIDLDGVILFCGLVMLEICFKITRIDLDLLIEIRFGEFDSFLLLPKKIKERKKALKKFVESSLARIQISRGILVHKK